MDIASATRSIGTSVIAALAAASAFAPATDAQTWIRDIESADIHVHGLAVRDDGLIAVARDNTSGGGITFFTPSGTMKSSIDLAAFDGSDTYVRDAAFLDDGTLALCGTAGNYPWVAAMNPDTGLPAWNTVLTTGSSIGYLSRMTVNELGHVVVQGEVKQGDSYVPFMAAVRPESNGGTAYRRLFGSGALTSLVPAQNGDLLMGSYASAVKITRTSNFANIKWRKSYGQSLNNAIPRLVETSSGDLMTVGLVRNGQSDYDFSAIKTTADGDFLWQRTYDTFPGTQFGIVNEVFDAVATDDGGVVAAVGQPMPGDGTRDAALLRLDAAGDVVWLVPFGKAGVNDVAVGVERTPDGGFVVAVKVEDGGLRLVRLDSAGNIGNCSVGTMFAADLPTGAVTTTTEDFDYTNYSGLWGDVTVTPIFHGSVVTSVCGEECTVAGSTYGSGTIGSAGLSPKLSSTDGTCLGYTPHLEVSNAVGGAGGLVFISFGPGSTPALGGTFLLDPSSFVAFPIVTGGPSGAPGAGEASFPMGTDLMPFLGFTLHLQGLFADANGPTGKTLTNGVTFAIQ